MTERRNKTTKSVGNGEGSLYYSEKLQKWVYYYYIEGIPNRQVLRQKKNEQVREFKARVRDLKNKVDNGTYIHNNKETFLEVLQKYIEQKHNDNITGQATYERDLSTKKEIEKTCSNFIDKPIQKITIEDIECSKIEIKKYSKNTINKIWQMLYKTFNIAVSRRKIVFNPMNDENLAKPVSEITPQKKKALTPKEEQKLFEALKDNPEQKLYNQAILLQLNIGARIGEVLALSEDCISLENTVMKIYRSLTREKGKYILGKHTKTYDRKTGIDKGKRAFVMTPNATKIVTELLKQNISNPDKLLFWDYERNTLISPRRINDYLKSLNDEYKITDEDLTSHTLRRTFITKCQRAGIPVVVIQAMVGHVEGSEMTDDIYTDVTLDFIREEIKKIA